MLRIIQAKIVEMHDVHGKTFNEIGAELGYSANYCSKYYRWYKRRIESGVAEAVEYPEIRNLGLSDNAYGCLTAEYVKYRVDPMYGIRTIEQLCAATVDDIKRRPGIGPKTLAEILEVRERLLAERGEK
jgi:hypothetical protein